ncbi:hypothetical protein [Deinococcus sp.]|uniref:hypothetical protein n=1 Tax=Deinococcus sp. TaxID=47478 RepID=UPI003CC5FA0B
MRVPVTGFNLYETQRQPGALHLETPLPYVLNVILPAPPVAAQPNAWEGAYSLLSVEPPGQEWDVQGQAWAEAFVAALGQERWTVRRSVVWMLSTGLSERAYALWNSLDAALEPFSDLTLLFELAGGG